MGLRVALHVRGAACERRGERGERGEHGERGEQRTEGLDVTVGKEGRLFGGGLWEVAHARRDGHLPCAGELARGLEAEAGRVAVLALPRVKVRVKVAHECLGGSVDHLEASHVRVPGSCLEGLVTLEPEGEELRRRRRASTPATPG
jgi:hypothetical protein